MEQTLATSVLYLRGQEQNACALSWRRLLGSSAALSMDGGLQIKVLYIKQNELLVLMVICNVLLHVYIVQCLCRLNICSFSNFGSIFTVKT